jgi:spore maturation protein SpmA
MLNTLWLLLLLCGIVVGGITGKIDLLGQSALASSRIAVMEIALPLVGTLALWLGMVRLAEKAGLVQGLARLIRPLMRLLFPEIPENHPAMGAMMMNIAANMLGISNAATPFGLKAMDQLNRLNSNPGVATNAMCTFLALNTSMIQLVPSTAMNILSINGSQHPAVIVGSTLLSTGTSTLFAIFIVKLFERLPWFKLKQPSVNVSPENEILPESETSQPMAQWGVWALSLLSLFFMVLLLLQAIPSLRTLPFFNAIPYPHGEPTTASPTHPSGYIINILRAFSPLAIPFFLTFFPLYAAAKGIPVYSEFVEGAKEGFQVAIRIIPYLVGMLVAIAVFRDSGCLDLLRQCTQPFLERLQIPSELLPIFFMRPLSGSGALATLSDIVKHSGADHLLSYMAATVYGSAETTFYVVAVYFGSVGISRTRYAIPVGLLSDIVGMLAAVWVCRWLFG